MDETKLLTCKKALQQRESELENKLTGNFGLEEEFSKEVSGELSNYDNHPGDQGTELFERSKDLALNEHAKKELADVKFALEKMEEGKYGICLDCGEEIPFERLQVIPTTVKCVDHAEEDRTNRDRPIEEEVIHPDIRSSTNIEKERVGYDAEDAWQEVNRYGSSDSPSDFYGDQQSYDELYPNHNENTDAPEDVENFIASNDQGDFDENTLDYYRSQK